MTNPYTTLSTRIAYENPWTRVREDRIRLPDGSDGVYGVVERSDFAIIVPWQDGRLTLVEQYRYPIAARTWEFPMGMWEAAPDIHPETLAAAELREETGLTAGAMIHGGELFQAPGYCTQRGHVYLATGLTPGEPAREATEQDMICRSFTLSMFEAMVRDGTVCEAMTIASYCLLRMKGLL